MQKFKKGLIYTLTAIGGLAVIYVAAVFFMQARDNMIYSGGYGGAAPMGLSSSNSKTADATGWGLNNLFSRSQQSGAYEQTSNTTPPVAEGSLTQRKIIRDGALSLLVKKAEDAAKEIENLAVKAGGFVGQSQVYEVSAGTKAGTVTIRVPADKFSETMAAAKKLAVKVERENQDAQDVTEQFVDLEAQLKNLQSVEAQYLEILKKADKVPDILQVQQQLNDVRGRIESLQGQLKYLSRQVDMSTITVSLTEEADVQVFGITWRPFYVIKQQFRNMLTGLTGFADNVIAFVFVLPVLLLWILLIALIALVLWKLLVWVKGKYFASPPKI